MIFCGLLAFFVLEYVRPATFLPFLYVFRLNSIVPLLTGVGNLVSGGRTTNRDVFREPNTKILFVFLGMIALTVFTGDVSEYAFNMLQGVFGYFLIFWVIVRQLDGVAKVKATFATLIAVHITLALLTPEMFTDSSGARHYLASGTFLSDGNDFALSVNLCIPLCLFLLFDARGPFRKGMLGAVLAFLVACVVLTQSRGGTVALACVGIYYWLQSDRKVMMGLLGAAMIAGIVLAAPAAYFERMDTISLSEGSAQGRIAAWKAAVRMALSNPIVGVGAGNFPFAYGEYRTPGDDGPVRVAAHSIYFLVLAELGFPGLGLLAFFIVWNLNANRRLIREIRSRAGPDATRQAHLLAGLSASLVAYATGGAFLSQLYTPHWCVLGGLLCVGQRLARVTIASTGAPTHAVEPGSGTTNSAPGRSVDAGRRPPLTGRHA